MLMSSPAGWGDAQEAQGRWRTAVGQVRKETTKSRVQVHRSAKAWWVEPQPVNGRGGRRGEKVRGQLLAATTACHQEAQRQ